MYFRERLRYTANLICLICACMISKMADKLRPVEMAGLAVQGNRRAYKMLMMLAQKSSRPKIREQIAFMANHCASSVEESSDALEIYMEPAMSERF